MHVQHDINQTLAPEPSAVRRWLGRTILTAALVATGLGLTACGSAASPTILDTEKVERAIERSSLTQRGARVHVSCPSGVHQNKGLVFSCTAVAKRGSTPFSVTTLDASGRVHYEAR
jgi:hypothetical protein